MNTTNINMVSQSTTTSQKSENVFSKKYIYDFDYPGIDESGYIEIEANHIKVCFPEKKCETTKTFNIRSVMLFINKQLKFSFDWLPIYSYTDYYRIKDMLNTCLFEFLPYYKPLKCLTNLNSNYVSQYNTSTVLHYHDSLFDIQCFEDYYNMNINVNFKEEKLSDSYSNTIDIQFYIGSNRIFSTLDLPVTSSMIYDVLEFILFKLAKS